MSTLGFIAALLVNICGVVNDSYTGKPVVNASVHIKGGENIVVTDSTGRFCIDVKDSAALEISMTGYRTLAAVLNASSGQPTLILENTSREMEEVVIEAVRADRIAPVTEHTLTSEVIARSYTGQETPVILSQTPSVTWYSDGGNYTGYSYMRLRGIDQTRINFTLNGVPLNEPEDQGAYFSNYPDFISSVRTVQVQRGVGVSSNGTASFAGSVNFESPSLIDTAYSELQGTYGSFDTHRISGEFNSGLMKSHIAAYARYSLTASDGYRYHSGTAGHSFFISAGYFGKKGVFKLTGFRGFSKNQMSYLAASETDLARDNRINYLRTDEKDHFLQDLYMLQYVMPLKGSSSLSSSVYYNQLQGGYGVFFSPDVYTFSVRSHFYGAMVNYKIAKPKWELNAGVHANTYERDHYLQPDEADEFYLYLNTGKKQELSSFVKAGYKINKVLLYADLQARMVNFTYVPDTGMSLPFDPVSWKFLNPRGGVSWIAGKSTVFYISAGKTWREPTRNDMFAGYDNIDSLNYSEVHDFTRVKPEQVTDIEAGIKIDRKKITADLNVFDMEFRNEIAAIGQLSYIGLPLRKNVSSSYRRGIELFLVAKPVKGLELTTQATFSNNRIKEYTTDYDSLTYTNVQPLLTPRVLIGENVRYSFEKWLALEVRGRYMSSSYLDNTNNDRFTVPSSLVFDASAEIRYRAYSLLLMVNNFTDQRYYTSGYVQNNERWFFPMATRNYFATLRLRF